MNLSKIRSLHVIIIGAVVCVIVGVGLFFVLIKPMKARISEIQSQYNASKQVADQEFSARNARDKAVEGSKKAQEDYAYFQRTKMPDVDFSSRGEGMLELWREQSIVLGPLIQKWPKRTGVRLLSALAVPAPPVNPNILQTELIEIPIGAVQVQGPFNKILEHLQSWNYFNRLVKIDLPNLVGPSPSMTSQYNLTVYIFPKGKPGPQIPLAGQAVAGAMPGMAGYPQAGMPSPMAAAPPAGYPPAAGGYTGGPQGVGGGMPASGKRE